MASLSIARAYQHSFDTHPNITLAITGGCLNSLGDIVAQVTEKTVRSQCLPRRLLSPTFLISGVEASTTTTNNMIFRARSASSVSVSQLVRYVRSLWHAANMPSRPLSGTVELLPGETVSSTLRHRFWQGQCQGAIEEGCL